MKVDTKKKTDSKAPKKPAAGAYGVFLAENREAVAKTLPGGSKITEVAKAVGAQWSMLSEEDKKPYKEKFLQKQEEYRAAMEAYKKKKLPAKTEEDLEDVS